MYWEMNVAEKRYGVENEKLTDFNNIPGSYSWEKELAGHRALYKN